MSRINGRLAVALVAATLAVASIWLLRRCGTPKHTADKVHVTAGAAGAVNADGTAAMNADGTRVAETPEAPDDQRVRVIDADARMALMRRIRAARTHKAGTPLPSGAEPDPGDPPALPGEITPEQLMDAIMPVMPMLKDCYTDGLARRTIKSGQVSFDMHLLGAPDVGTVVDSADLGGDPAFLADAELAQCLQETMMSVELPPMQDGSELEFKTTMKFADEPDEVGPHDAR